MRVLLKYGANPNISNKYSNTPLHVAALNNFQDICEILIEAKADIMRENYVSAYSSYNMEK